jgi:hypothetical protein
LPLPPRPRMHAPRAPPRLHTRIGSNPRPPAPVTPVTPGGANEATYVTPCAPQHRAAPGPPPMSHSPRHRQAHVYHNRRVNQQLRRDEDVKQWLHDVATRLRSAFVAHDGRLTGKIPRFLLPSCLKAGGFELTRQEMDEAIAMFPTNDGRFAWKAFCNSIESARQGAWGRAKRLPLANTLKEMAPDRRTPSLVGERELADAVQSRWAKHHAMSGQQLQQLLAKCSHGGGKVDFGQFCSGTIQQIVAPPRVA